MHVPAYILGANIVITGYFFEGLTMHTGDAQIEQDEGENHRHNMGGGDTVLHPRTFGSTSLSLNSGDCLKACGLSPDRDRPLFYTED